MKQDKIGSLLQELVDAFFYMIDSIQGKLSLESYLEILSQYADALIYASKQEGLSYQDGSCSVCADESRHMLLFSLEFFFMRDDLQAVKKSAERALPYEKFTRETVKKVQRGSLRFHIDLPPSIERG